MTQQTSKANITPEPPTPPATKGLTQLDKERAGSMADEGGAAGAVVEGPEPAPSGVGRSRPDRGGASKHRKPVNPKDGRQ